MTQEGHSRWRDDLAAYVLGSLDAEETAQLERHLDGCESCRTELRWLGPAIEVLSDSVERVEPPPALRRRLIAEVREGAGKAEAPARRPLAERMRSLMLRPATALAATAVVGAGVAGYALQGGGGNTTTVVEVPGPGPVTAKLKRSGDAGTLELTGLEQLPSNRVYETWIQHGQRVERSTLFSPRRDGTASARIPHDLDGADMVMVTVERQGGRPQPTSAQLVNVPISD
jgi:anti-sigma-K factor RskA